MSKNQEKKSHLSHRGTLEATTSNCSNARSTGSKPPFDVTIRSIKGSRSGSMKTWRSWKRYKFFDTFISVNTEFTAS